MKLRNFTLLLMLGGFCCATQADEKVDEIEKKVCKRWEKVKTLQGEMNMTSEQSRQGMDMKMSMTTDFKLMREGEKTKTRQQGEQQTTMNMGGNEQEMGGDILVVSDGETVWILTEMMGRQQAMKRKADPSQQYGGGCDMFEALKKDSELAYSGEDTVNDDKTWVVTAKPKEPQQGAPAKSKLYFRQSDGVLVKMEGMNDAGEKMVTMTLTDIKVNEKVDPDVFIFKAPEGVQVMDMSNMP